MTRRTRRFVAGASETARTTRGAEAFEKPCTMCHEPARLIGETFITPRADGISAIVNRAR